VKGEKREGRKKKEEREEDCLFLTIKYSSAAVAQEKKGRKKKEKETLIFNPYCSIAAQKKGKKKERNMYAFWHSRRSEKKKRGKGKAPSGFRSLRGSPARGGTNKLRGKEKEKKRKRRGGMGQYLRHISRAANRGPLPKRKREKKGEKRRSHWRCSRRNPNGPRKKGKGGGSPTILLSTFPLLKSIASSRSSENGEKRKKKKGRFMHTIPTQSRCTASLGWGIPRVNYR